MTSDTKTNQPTVSRRVYEMVRGRENHGELAKFGDDFSLMTVKEACADARISPATFYRLVKKDPHFPSLLKIGSGTRVRSDAWRRYVDALATAGGDSV